MISVVVFGSLAARHRSPTPEDAVRTLSALVSGAVDGVIRDVQLLATRDPDLAKVAEHAGCGFLRGDIAEALPRAVAATRSPALLLLLTGISFDRALTDELAGLATRHPGWLEDGTALKAETGGTIGHLLPRFAPTLGVLTTRERLTGATPTNLPAFWRSLRPRRVLTTRAWTGA